jgi:hypothetical protein
MVDTLQLILIIVIVVLTSLLTIIGIQVFFIFKELHQSMIKINKILDDAGIISESVSKPVSSLSGFLTGLKGGLKIFEVLEKKTETAKKNE